MYFIPANDMSNVDTITTYVPNIDKRLYKKIKSISEEELLASGYEKLKASIGFVTGCYVKSVKGFRAPSCGHIIDSGKF